MSKPEKMVLAFNAAVAQHLGVTPEDAWGKTLDLLAWKSHLINAGLPRGFTRSEATEVAEEHFDAELYERGHWDYLGECYCRLQGSKQMSELMPRATAERTAALAAENNPDADGMEPIRVLDPNCSTGRYLIAAHQVFANKGFYMGCEERPVFYKMALLNLVLLGIPGAVINADNMCVDLTEDATWDACNEWT